MDIWTKPPAAQPTLLSLDDDRCRQSPTANECKIPSAEGDRVHRVAIETELLERGRGASNQLDKLQGLLKSSPRQYILRKYPVNVPALSVVHYPNVDPCCNPSGEPAIEDYRKGYTTGPKRLRSVTVKGNHLPLADYERHKFVCQRGQDFK